MENKESKVVTFEDLVKYTEEVLFPGLEEIMDEKIDNLEVKMNKKFDKIDEKFDKVDEKFELINQELVNIRCELSDIHSEISAIKLDLKDIEARLSRLETMTKEDLNMNISEIEALKKANQVITKRLIILENQKA